MWRYVLSTVGALLLFLLGFGATPAAQKQPPPVIDMHLHAVRADSQGPPPLGLCPGNLQVAAWDQRQAWAQVFGALMKNPPCTNPVWSPTDDELRAQTIAVLNRRNVIALAGGSPEMVAARRTAAPSCACPKSRSIAITTADRPRRQASARDG